MKAKIAELVATLRREDVAISVAEAIDAAQAAALAGVERSVLRDALAATLVKDERDRAVFLAAFATVFPARGLDVRTRSDRKRHRDSGAGGEGGGGSSAGGADGAPRAQASRGGAESPSDAATRGAPGVRDLTPSAVAVRSASPRAGSEDADDGTRNEHDEGERGERDDATDQSDSGDGAIARARGTEERRLLRLPFRAMTPTDVDACAALARALARRVAGRVRRRLAPRKTGRLDFRRTIRAAVPHGGVPFERRYRGRRPGAPTLVALCDLSASTATASEFFLAVLAPAAAYFRKVRLFGFVDRLVEIEFVAGHMRPAGPLDLMARSDFGRVLKDLAAESSALFGADTILLVLADARNNRRPPRADLLAAARARVRRLLWLNPDPRERWNTGDSVIATYARHADAVVACGTLAELERALAAVAKL